MTTLALEEQRVIENLAEFLEGCDPGDGKERLRIYRRSHMVNATTPLVSQMVSSSQEFVEAGH